MVEQITSGIKISVETIFDGSFYKQNTLYYSFGYRITITNQSKDMVQLNSREWVIIDALNDTQYVAGQGVVGKKPVLEPGDTYTYNSGCILTSPIGAMYGNYNMINFSNTKTFKVEIPTFRLSAPFALN